MNLKAEAVQSKAATTVKKTHLFTDLYNLSIQALRKVERETSQRVISLEYKVFKQLKTPSENEKKKKYCQKPNPDRGQRIHCRGSRSSAQRAVNVTKELAQCHLSRTQGGWAGT